VGAVDLDEDKNRALTVAGGCRYPSMYLSIHANIRVILTSGGDLTIVQKINKNAF
jgi:hypothetical protein